MSAPRTVVTALRYAQLERGGPPGDYLAEDVIGRVISELSRLRDDLTTPGGDNDAEWAAEEREQGEMKRRPRFDALPSLGRNTVLRLFARRHESPEMRLMLRSSIHDAKLWLRWFA